MHEAGGKQNRGFDQARTDYNESLKVFKKTIKDLHEQVRRTKDQIADLRIFVEKTLEERANIPAQEVKITEQQSINSGAP